MILKDYGLMSTTHIVELVNKLLHLFNMEMMLHKQLLIQLNIKILNMSDLFWVVTMIIDIQDLMVNSQEFHLIKHILVQLMNSKHLSQRSEFHKLD